MFEKNSAGKTNTFLNEHGYNGFNGFLFSNKNYIPQGNNIRENLHNPCSKNSVGKTNTFKANTDITDSTDSMDFYS